MPELCPTDQPAHSASSPATAALLPPREALFSRRQAMLRLASAGVAARAFLRAQTSPAPAIPSWNTELRQLAPNIYAYTQASGPGVDNASLSNAGVIAGDDLLAIDALGPPVHAKAFIAAARKATGKPFGRLVNTHHHRDHTNGNCFFLPAEIVGHEFCRQAVIDQGIPEHPYADRPQWQEGMEQLRLTPPSTTFADRLTYRYGGTEVQLIYNGPAHTWGDVMVYVPQHKILFAGDIAFYYVGPAGHNGHLTKWLDAIDRAMQIDADIIVPGHGPVGTKRELAETRAYLDLLIREVTKRWRAGMTPGKAAADIDMGRFSGWTNPERIVWNTVRLYAEFNGSLTPQMDVAGTARAMDEYTAVLKARAR